MNFELTPQPTEEERAAILAALNDEPSGDEPSPWARELLPRRDGEDAGEP
jgi:hypothetical protein